MGTAGHSGEARYALQRRPIHSPVPWPRLPMLMPVDSGSLHARLLWTAVPLTTGLGINFMSVAARIPSGMVVAMASLES